MKILSGSIFILLILSSLTGCNGKRTGGKEQKTEIITTSVPDTGFTGIKKYMSGQYLSMEVTLENGVRQGLTKTFYIGGQLRQTFWYDKGLIEDSSRWFYTEGQIFRTTPYKHDTIEGIQKQYYRTGKVKARIGYSKGLRTDYFEEYTPEGILVKGYPGIEVDINDEYNSKGVYHIGLTLSDKSSRVKFYRGDFTNSRFDTTMYKTIRVINGKAILDLKKSGTPGSDNVGVIAEILTPYGNKLISWKKIQLPYNDLK